MSNLPIDAQISTLLLARFPDAKKTLSKLSALAVVRGVTGLSAVVPFDDNEVERCRSFIHIADSIRSELQQMDPELTEVFDRVGEAFERFPEMRDRETDAVSRLRSALNYVGAVKLSSARIVAPDGAAESYSSGRVNHAESFLMTILQSLIRHQYGNIVQSLCTKQALRTLVSEVLNVSHETAELESGIIICAAQAASQYSQFSFSANMENLERARNDVAEAARLARTLGDPPISCLIDELHFLIERFPLTYSRSVLSAWLPELGASYLATLTQGQHQIHQLWPSQIHALNQGLLKSKNAAVAMPTSAGKTLLAELKIAAALNANPDGCVFYIVPLNALARQAQKQLQQRLRQNPLTYNIKVLTGAYELEDTDLSLIKRENVIITTPEKLDMLLRTSAEESEIQKQLDRCCLVVFDEFQNLGEGRRGVTYEFLISRLRQRIPSAGLLCLSPKVTNIDRVAEWIESEVKGIQTDWRPTRLHYASWGPKGLRFDEGFSLPNYKREIDAKDNVPKVALDLQKTFESVLVMATSRQNAESYANQIWEAVQSEAAFTLSGEELVRLKDLADFVRGRTHSKSMLARFIEFGIAYHHSHVPPDIRIRIEDLILEKTVKIVVATTTLAEGVNLPVRCVLLPNIYFGDGAMSAIKLQNIFGRAARAGFTTEGQVVVFQKSDWVKANDRFLDFYQYCFSPSPDLLQIHSRLVSATPGDDSSDNIEVLQALDSQILGMFLDGTAPSENYSKNFSKFSFCVADDPAALPSVEALIASRVKGMIEGPRPLLAANSPLALTQYGKQAARVGLGRDELDIIANEIEMGWPTIHALDTSRDLGDMLQLTFLKSILVPCFLLPRNLFASVGVGDNSKQFFGVSPTSAKEHLTPVISAIRERGDIYEAMIAAIEEFDLAMIASWLQGAPPIQFAQQFQSKTARTKIEKQHKGFEKALETSLMDAIQYFEWVSTALSYSAYVIETVAAELSASKGISTAAELGNCSLFLKYGVDHPIAVFLLKETAIRDRNRALQISKQFRADFFYTSKECAQTLASRVDRLRGELSDEEFKTMVRATHKYALGL
ncbi:MAG: DEAD/DEAH box helicase [Acidobacteriaceae bacterium]